MAPTLFYRPRSPPCQLVLLIAKHLNLELKLVDIHPLLDEPTAEFLKASPARTIPALDDNGFLLSESRAIAVYLLEKYGKDDPLLPKDPNTKALVLQRMFFDENLWQKSFRSIVRPVLYFNTLPKLEDYETLSEALACFNTLLEGSKWLAGDNVTVADYSSLVVLSFIEILGLTNLDKFANITSWLQKLKTIVKGFDVIVDPNMKAVRDVFIVRLNSLKIH